MNEVAIQFSTADVPEHISRDIWREKASQAFVELDIGIDEKNHFFGDFEKKIYSDWAITQISGTASLVRRRRKAIKRSNADCFLISLQLKGTSILRQDHRKSLLKPGDIALYDTTRPYDLNITDNNNAQFVIEVPRKICEDIIKDTKNITAIKITEQQQEAKQFKNFLKSLYLSNSVEENKFTDLLNIFSTAFNRSNDKINIEQLSNQSSRVLIIKDFVNRNLEDEHLDQTAVANEFNISRRYLNQLFEHEPLSFSEWLRNSRLEKCSQDLINPSMQNFSVLDIAYKWGFKDPAHFSRLFKKYYKITARDYRKLNTEK